MVNYQNLHQLRTLDIDELKLRLEEANFLDLDLKYRGEGNQNLVFSISNIRYVLRFRKSITSVDLEKENEDLKMSFLYHYIIVKSFFTDVFSLIPILVEIPTQTLTWLDEFFLKFRPHERQFKHLSYNTAEIYPDLAFLPLYQKFIQMKGCLRHSAALNQDVLKEIFHEKYLDHRNFVFSLFTNATFRESLLSRVNISNADTLCVEIKPKQGWTAESDRLSGICPFCLNQYQKLSTRKINAKSGYCPLDLFSGDTERMLRALKELLKCPQNNFKIFKNGQLLFGENVSNDLNRVLCQWFNDEDIERCVNNFCFLITKMLTYEVSDEEGNYVVFNCDVQSKNDQISPSNFNAELIEQILTMLETRCRQETSSLPSNCILGRILNLQKMDSAGLEAARNYLSDHIVEYSTDYGYVCNLISMIKSVQPDNIVNLNILEAYLLSTAAKDLSVLMSFERILDGEGVSGMIIRDHVGHPYCVNISVVDVGPKPVSCLEKHKKRDENVLNAFIAYHCANLTKGNKS